MQILVTGTPGTGKSRIAGIVAKKFNLKLINDKEFAQQNNCGKLDKKTNEFEVDIKKFKKKFRRFAKENPNSVFEGHLFCEFSFKADMVFVLTTKPELLEKRLHSRGYNAVKVLDNVFCEQQEYCLKKSRKNFKKVVKLENNKAFKHLQNNIIKILEKEFKNSQKK